MVIFTIMCVQPLEISVEAFKIVSGARIGPSHYKTPSIKWVKKFNDIHHRSKHFCSILSMPDAYSDLLKEDLSKEDFYVYKNHDISEFFIEGSAKLDLIYDERLATISIVTEFSFSIDESHICELFNDNDYDRKRHNFYNTIRNLMVKEEDLSQIGSWNKKIRHRCLSRVSQLFYSGKKVGVDKPKILNNTGNITVQVDGISTGNRDRYRSLIVKSNQMAERVENNSSTLINNNDVQYVFYGRFHTILSRNRDYYYRFFPIQYHAQFMWHAVHSFTSVMDELNRQMLLGLFTDRKGVTLIDNYINKFELVRIHNQDMKMYFESDSESVFAEIESKWSIKESLNEVNNYITSFKEFIERSYQRKMENSNRRQNKILFIISCLQMLGLVSIWGDYLSLAKMESFAHSTGFVKDSDKVFLLAFNTWFPVILLALLFFLVYKVIFKKE